MNDLPPPPGVTALRQPAPPILQGLSQELLSGQARFDVAHDAARPFSVHAGGQTVVATGTAFNVDLLGPQVLVTLINVLLFSVGDLPEVDEAESKNPKLSNDQAKDAQRVSVPVTINGTGLIQATSVKFGTVQATTFSVVSDSEVTADVPSGLAAGTVTISITTPGGTANSPTKFTVN